MKKVLPALITALLLICGVSGNAFADKSVVTFSHSHDEHKSDRLIEERSCRQNCWWKTFYNSESLIIDIRVPIPDKETIEKKGIWILVTEKYKKSPMEWLYTGGSEIGKKTHNAMRVKANCEQGTLIVTGIQKSVNGQEIEDLTHNPLHYPFEFLKDNLLFNFLCIIQNAADEPDCKEPVYVLERRQYYY